MQTMTIAKVTSLAVALSFAGCAHVGQEDFDAELAQLRTEMRDGDEAVSNRLGTRIDGVDARTRQLEERMNSLESELRALEAEFDVTVDRMEMAIRFNTPIHFGFDEAEITPDHRPLLERFASVVGEYYPGAILTVEGFTDPSGSAAYNKQLGQRRADAVRSWLVAEGSLMEDRVRAVSYGENTERLVRPGAEGPGNEGRLNRRVVVVIEHSDAAVRAMITEGSSTSSGQ